MPLIRLAAGTPVAPRAEAWIETPTRCWSRWSTSRSPPARGRGSKLGCGECWRQSGMVAPRAGAWIETRSRNGCGRRTPVAPVRRRGSRPQPGPVGKFLPTQDGRRRLIRGWINQPAHPCGAGDGQGARQRAGQPADAGRSTGARPRRRCRQERAGPRQGRRRAALLGRRPQEPERAPCTSQPRR